MGWTFPAWHSLGCAGPLSHQHLQPQKTLLPAPLDTHARTGPRRRAAGSSVPRGEKRYPPWLKRPRLLLLPPPVSAAAKEAQQRQDSCRLCKRRAKKRNKEGAARGGEWGRKAPGAGGGLGWGWSPLGAPARHRCPYLCDAAQPEDGERVVHGGAVAHGHGQGPQQEQEAVHGPSPRHIWDWGGGVEGGREGGRGVTCLRRRQTRAAGDPVPATCSEGSGQPGLAAPACTAHRGHRRAAAHRETLLRRGPSPPPPPPRPLPARSF